MIPWSPFLRTIRANLGLDASRGCVLRGWPVHSRQRRARRKCAFHRRGRCGKPLDQHQDQGLFHLVAGRVVERIPWAIWGGRTSLMLCSPILCGAASGLDFSRRRGVFQGRSGPRIVSALTGWARAASGPSTRSGRYALGRDPGRTEPDERRPRDHADQQERIALRYGSLGDGRRRPFVLAVHGLRPGAHCPGRAGRVGRRSEADDPDHGFRQLRRRQEPLRPPAATARVSPSPRMEKCGSCLATASASSIRVTFRSTNSRRRCTSSKSLPTARHICKTLRATSSNLRLPPLIRDLEIDYTALSLVAPEKNRFASSWKAGIATGRTSAIAGRRSITIFLHATTASA